MKKCPPCGPMTVTDACVTPAQINRAKLYGRDPGSKERYPQLAPAMTRPIRGE